MVIHWSWQHAISIWPICTPAGSSGLILLLRILVCQHFQSLKLEHGGEEATLCVPQGSYFPGWSSENPFYSDDPPRILFFGWSSKDPFFLDDSPRILFLCMILRGSVFFGCSSEDPVPAWSSTDRCISVDTEMQLASKAASKTRWPWQDHWSRQYQ